MRLTEYHSKLFAFELTKRCATDSPDKLAKALVDAQVDLNPHQIEAALFAFRSPLSTGALLADEVGLGKTIEAGLVLSQKWAERKRRILIIAPSNLRKQWYQELIEKFSLPCRILEAKTFNTEIAQGNLRPFYSSEIVICSYQFAKSKSSDVQVTPWDIVVIDEAHRLRNVYKPSNVIANTLKTALSGKYKLLLTATPLQNSLLELFGLVSFIDEHSFGDLASFREQFSNLNQKHVFGLLKARLKPVCHRTLRRQVMPYVRYTQRLPITQPFSPEEGEDRLYHLVSDYLRRDNLQALPSGQRTLMTLVLRKLLASSTFAIAGALQTISQRLRDKLAQQEPAQTLEEELDQDFETLDEVAEEWSEDSPQPDALSPEARQALEREIVDLERFTELALSIEFNAKGKALLVALDRAFEEAEKLGASRKAIIFTESRRTQDYLLRVLSDSKFSEGIVLFNGSNNDDRSKSIYTQWIDEHQGTDRVTGSRTADIRSALVDYFSKQGQIMIATEAAAEGINLQFCSLVVNYDLPWNPQRIEQRIGRCHRYGQKHDVVVVNFLNQKNEADQRVFQLLSEKFKLFEGVFGASDEVLGALESGVDFEKRIVGIYQECRTSEDIQAAFDQLQDELKSQINETMAHTREQLLENFDEEVHEKLRIRQESSLASLNKYEKMLMQLTRYELRDHASFPTETSFQLNANPFAGSNAPLGLYELPRRSGEAHLYRLGHPLAEHIIQRAKSRELPSAKIVFDYTGYEAKISALEPLVGQEGQLTLSLLTIEALDQAEDYLLIAAITNSQVVLDDDTARRMISLPASSVEMTTDPLPCVLINELLTTKASSIKGDISKRNAQFFEAEAAKLDGWADDLKVGLEREIKELDRQIKETRRAATLALTLEDKLAGQKQMKALEAVRNQKRRSLFDAQDQVDKQREELIEKIEGKLAQKSQLTQLFAIRWQVA